MPSPNRIKIMFLVMAKMEGDLIKVKQWLVWWVMKHYIIDFCTYNCQCWHSSFWLLWLHIFPLDVLSQRYQHPLESLKEERLIRASCYTWPHEVSICRALLTRKICRRISFNYKDGWSSCVIYTSLTDGMLPLG